jgi:hypothetical protein
VLLSLHCVSGLIGTAHVALQGYTNVENSANLISGSLRDTKQ